MDAKTMTGRREISCPGQNSGYRARNVPIVFTRGLHGFAILLNSGFAGHGFSGWIFLKKKSPFPVYLHPRIIPFCRLMVPLPIPLSAARAGLSDGESNRVPVFASERCFAPATGTI
jgi:hypothetical protein